MTGGILQLVTKGIDDAFLTENPSITLFKIVYRRYTNFSKCEKRLNFPHDMTFGQSGSCELRRLADLVHKIYLTIELPDVLIKQRKLTPSLLSVILEKYGIIIPNLPNQNQLNQQEPTIISQDYYETNIIPYIQQHITNYETILMYAVNELVIYHKASNFKYLEKHFDIAKYMNPELDLTETVNLNTVIIPIKYKIYNDYLKCKNNELYSLYSLIYGYFEDIPNNKIIIHNPDTIRHLLYIMILEEIYNISQDNITSYDYLFSDIFNIPDNLINSSETYFEDIITNNIINKTVIPQDILYNLDTYKLYTRIKSDSNSQDNITIKNRLNNILAKSLTNNLDQYSHILNIITNFNVNNPNKFIYGFLIYNNTIYETIHNRNNLIYNHNINQNKDDLYNNNIKDLINNFCVGLAQIVRGQNNKYMQYYNNIGLWPYIEQSQYIPACIHNLYKSDNKIISLDLMPFLVLENIEHIFNNLILNHTKYINFILLEYKKEVDFVSEEINSWTEYGLSYDFNNITHNLPRLCNPILNHTFRPRLYYYKKDILDTILHFDCHIINIIENIYNGHIPDILYTLDVLLIMIAYDIIHYINTHDTHNPHNTHNPHTRNKSEYITECMAILSNYIQPDNKILYYEDKIEFDSLIISSHSTTFNAISIMSSIWSNIIRHQQKLYNKFIQDLTEHTDNNINNGLYLSYIYEEYKKCVLDRLHHIEDNIINHDKVKIIDYYNLSKVGIIYINEMKQYINQSHTLANSIKDNRTKYSYLLDITKIRLDYDVFQYATIQDIIFSGFHSNNHDYTFYNYDYHTNYNNQPKNNGYLAKLISSSKPYPANFIKRCENMVNISDLDLSNIDIFDIEDSSLLDVIINLNSIVKNKYGLETKKLYNKILNYISIDLDKRPYNITIPEYLSENMSNKYKNCNSIHNIFLLLLDLMIKYDNSQSIFNTNEFDTDILDNITTQETYQTYLENIINKYTSYLEYISIQKDTGYIYTNSKLYKRLNNFFTQECDFAWSKYIGYNLIEELSIKIGDQLIDTHDYKWMYIDYMMNRKESKDYGHNNMVGHLPELYELNSKPKRKHILYIPLKFWFCNHINLALPLISMQHTHVSISLKLKDLNKVAYWNIEDTYFTKEPKLKSYLEVDYIYLDTEERKKYSEEKHEFLIETNQSNRPTYLYKNSREEDNILRLNLYYANVCKFITWTIKIYTYQDNQDNINNINSENNILNWIDFEYNNDINAINSFQISLNNRIREGYKTANYYNYVQPYKSMVSSLPKNIFLYSFCLYPNMLQPSGGINLSMINDFNIDMRLSDKTNDLLNNDKIKIEYTTYAKTYNILRIMSGMAGLAFYG